MSYILEALKRAEADRKAEAAAATPAGRRPTATAARRPLWPWLVGGGLVLNALVGGAVFLVPRGSSPAVSAPSGVGVEPTAAVAETPRAEEAPAAEAPGVSTPIAEKRIAEGAVPLQRPRATTAQPPAPSQRTATARSAEPTQPSAPTQAAVPARPANREPVARPQPEAKAAATPPPPTATSLQAVASKLKIEVLVWGDNPNERMVFLNGRKYVEGQALAGGAVIEQIAQDGIVLVHEGQRARVRAETK